MPPFYRRLVVRISGQDAIDTAAAAARLGVNLSRIRVLLQQRRIPGAKRVGRQWFIPEDFVVTPGTRGPKLRK